MYNFIFKPFSELSTLELYKALQLRQQIFVVEQNSVYIDLDNYDINRHHILGYDANDELVMYCRIIEPGGKYADASSIGRVVLKKELRGNGAANELVKEAIKNTFTIYPDYNIKISAQAHLEKFYNRFGFIKTTEPYIEDNIPHVEMILKNVNCKE